MPRFSDNYDRSEFRCNCGKCENDAVDAELLSILEELHCYLSSRFNKKIYVEITSGNRCMVYNLKKNGALKSQHVLSKAADIRGWLTWHVEQIDPEILADFLDLRYPDWYGIGRYDTFTHIDVRPNKARWDNRTERDKR